MKMQYALAESGDRCVAAKGLTAFCPLCRNQVVPKCGKIKIHHWAHKANDCDSWSEPESEWHRSWKNFFPSERVEFPIANHRADIVRYGGQVVELQHSSISVDEIEAREKAYGNMCWLFDGTDLDQYRFNLRRKDNFYSFRWIYPRMHYAFCKKSTYIDLGGAIFHLKKFDIRSGAPYGGWGYLISLSNFVDKLTSGRSKIESLSVDAWFTKRTRVREYAETY